MKIYSVNNKKFEKFGKVISCPIMDNLFKTSEEIELPVEGVIYKPSVEQFEIADNMKFFTEFFGGMDIQIGYCYGRNNALNALEWHKSNEVNCALEDMVLMLADIRDVKDGVLDTSKVVCFEVKKGESVELYATTLHFCPCRAEGKPFKSVVVLPKGTNTPLENKGKDKYIISKNKWLIIHPENKKQVELGRTIGLKGKNLSV